MATNITLASDGSTVEYHGIAHSQSMTQAIVSGNDIDNRPGQIVRNEVGKFVSGTVGGPGRRPITLISEALKQKLAAGEAEKLADELVRIGTDTEARRSDRIAAIAEITDRVEGKATQRIDTRGVFVVLAPEAGNLAQLDQWADE